MNGGLKEPRRYLELVRLLDDDLQLDVVAQHGTSHLGDAPLFLIFSRQRLLLLLFLLLLLLWKKDTNERKREERDSVWVSGENGKQQEPSSIPADEEDDAYSDGNTE